VHIAEEREGRSLVYPVHNVPNLILDELRYIRISELLDITVANGALKYAIGKLCTKGFVALHAKVDVDIEIRIMMYVLC